MGCVLGRQLSSEIATEAKEEKDSRNRPNKKADNVAVTKSESNVVEVQNNETQKVEKADAGDQRPRAERRRSRPNPRLSNPSKRGEQVAAGWPSWLSAVCGEALNGWIPRRADSFEKIDKVGCFSAFNYVLCHSHGVCFCS